jgi:hypothetical protein
MSRRRSVSVWFWGGGFGMLKPGNRPVIGPIDRCGQRRKQRKR